MKLRILKSGGIVAFILAASLASAQDFQVGVRGGAGFSTTDENFRQAEAFTDINLPWHWNFCSDWRFQTKVDASVGWLGNNNDNAFIGTAGPDVVLSKGKFPLTLEGGSSPTILSRDQFGSKNFGDRFQFTSHIGVNWNITDHFTFGYRFQHMSNAGIASPNPGLNLQMIAFSYRF